MVFPSDSTFRCGCMIARQLLDKVCKIISFFLMTHIYGHTIAATLVQQSNNQSILSVLYVEAFLGNFLTD